MRWENLRDGAIYIENSMWESHVLDPKTRASKAPIPVIPSLAAMLKRHRERIGNPVAGPMFPAANGQPISLNNVANRQILTALNRCAICSKAKPAHIDATVDHEFQRDTNLPVWHGWHAFRRGLATNLYRLGVSDKVIQAILRHSNLATTMNVYVRTVSEDSVNAMKALEALMCAERAPEKSEIDIPVVN
jgi:integrase